MIDDFNNPGLLKNYGHPTGCRALHATLQPLVERARITFDLVTSANRNLSVLFADKGNKAF